MTSFLELSKGEKNSGFSFSSNNDNSSWGKMSVFFLVIFALGLSSQPLTKCLQAKVHKPENITVDAALVQ